LPSSKDLPSSLVQLRLAVWTGVARDTRPICDIATVNCCTAGRPYAAPVKAESPASVRSMLLSYVAPGGYRKLRRLLSSTPVKLKRAKKASVIMWGVNRKENTMTRISTVCVVSITCAALTAGTFAASANIGRNDVTTSSIDKTSHGTKIAAQRELNPQPLPPVHGPDAGGAGRVSRDTQKLSSPRHCKRVCVKSSGEGSWRAPPQCVQWRIRCSGI